MRKYLLAAGLWLLACSLVAAQQGLTQAGARKKATVAGTTFDPAHTHADITLSGGNKVATNASGNAVFADTRTTTSKVNGNGKLYIESKLTTLVAAFANEIGITDGVTTGFDKPQSGTANGNATGIFTYNHSVNLGADAVSGDVVSIAIDFDAGGLWFGINAVYSGTQNPATGANPDISWTPTSTPIFFWIAMFGASGTQVQTLQVSGSQSFSPPAGFTAWP